MSEHYIKQINIVKVRHLRGIKINLNPVERQHLILTGKNGSGKTSVLRAIKKELLEISKREIGTRYVTIYSEGVDPAIYISYNQKEEELQDYFKKGDFITAFFAADRTTNIIRPEGVREVVLEKNYDVDGCPADAIVEYMVHLKTQQLYASQENDVKNAGRIREWFERFENALKKLLDDKSVYLDYDYKKYNFLIYQDGREPYGFDQLADGYSAAINILSDLILRMDQNWLLGDSLSVYNKEEVVLIDEIETHLHVELQRKIMPFLIEFFPRIQFIVSTHSPYIITSVKNAVVYDLERKVAVNDLSNYSSDDVAEGFLGAENYSLEIGKVIARYRELRDKKEITEDERVERAELRTRLKNAPGGLGVDLRSQLEAIEEGRKQDG